MTRALGLFVRMGATSPPEGHRRHAGPARLAIGVALVCLALAGASAGSGSAGQPPDPCTAVPAADVAAALHAATPPPSTLATVRNVQTCSFGTGQLTISIGYTALGSPAVPIKESAVPGIPHGYYMTYRATTQTEISFYVGSAATGVYGVVRNFAKISKKELIVIAQALYAGMAGLAGSSSGAAPGAHLIG